MNKRYAEPAPVASFPIAFAVIKERRCGTLKSEMFPDRTAAAVKREWAYYLRSCRAAGEPIPSRWTAEVRTLKFAGAPGAWTISIRAGREIAIS